jgi:hypothetical protein
MESQYLVKYNVTLLPAHKFTPGATEKMLATTPIEEVNEKLAAAFV